MKSIFMTVVLGSTIATLVADAAPAAIRFQSDVKSVPLLELYTSEGCSSCPPAEDWLNRLNDSPGLWKSFVPVALHVDYWNSLGWTDRWSSPDFSERQRAYSQFWHEDTIYTPCFVLNGTEWRGWLLHREVPRDTGTDVGVLEVTSTDTNRWSATFVPATPMAGAFEVHAALLTGGRDSDVAAGENKGRRLHHEFAALELVQICMTPGIGLAHGKFIVDLQRYHAETSLALAVWVTRAGELTPLQATGGWLSQPRGGGK